jgi:hypothetical protein
VIPTQAQIDQWLSGSPEPNVLKLGMIADSVFAEEGRTFGSIDPWDKFIEFLKTNSQKFLALMHKYEHGIEASVLAGFVVVELCEKHQFTVDQAHLISVGVLHAIFQVAKK